MQKGLVTIMIISLWGWYGFKNYGDDIMLLNSYIRIQKEFPDAKIYLFGNKENINELSINTEYIYKRNVINWIKAALISDVLIWNGGTGLPHKNNFKILFLTFLSWIMKMRKKKFIFLGVGVSKSILKNRFSLKLLTVLIKHLSLFTCRQKEIINYIPINKYCNMHIRSDLAFCYIHPVIAVKKPIIGISVANVSIKSNQSFNNTFIYEIIMFGKYLKKIGYDLRFISFSDNDNNLNEHIANQLNSSCIHYSTDLNKMLLNVSECKFIIAMRFHAVVTALSLNIPVLSIAYSEKSTDLMEQFRLDNLYILFGTDKKEYSGIFKNISSVELIEKFNYMRENEKKIVNQINTILPEIIKNSEDNYNILFRYIRGDF